MFAVLLNPQVIRMSCSLYRQHFITLREAGRGKERGREEEGGEGERERGRSERGEGGREGGEWRDRSEEKKAWTPLS